MKKIGIVAALATLALVVGLAGLGRTTEVQAEPTDVTVISCAVFDEFLSAVVDCTDGLSDAEQDTLAGALGDEDGELEASDLEDEGLDLDGNQLNEHADEGAEASLVFAFVDDDDKVTLDPKHLDSPDNGGDADDANVICGPTGDFVEDDCDELGDGGNGVVVFALTACDNIITCDASNKGAVDAGDTEDIVVEQDMWEVEATINVVGDPDEIEIVELEEVLSIEYEGCGADWDDPDAGDDGDKIVLAAVVTDSDDTPLTGVPVDWDVDDDDLADIDDDSGMTLDLTEDLGMTAALAVLCGADETGEVEVEAAFDSRPGDTAVDPVVEEESDTATKTVVGLPEDIALTASPAELVCDGVNSADVTATVTDADGNFVVDGTEVRFDVVALGTAYPIVAETVDGEAYSTITPLSGITAGVTVIVSAGEAEVGEAEAAIIVACIEAVPTPPPPPPPTPTPMPTPPIVPPPTGTGGYLAGDVSGLSWWVLAGLAMGGLTLSLGSLALRRYVR